jgi:hypothetical protein
MLAFMTNAFLKSHARILPIEANEISSIESVDLRSPIHNVKIDVNPNKVFGNQHLDNATTSTTETTKEARSGSQIPKFARLNFTLSSQPSSISLASPSPTNPMRSHPGSGGFLQISAKA